MCDGTAPTCRDCGSEYQPGWGGKNRHDRYRCRPCYKAYSLRLLAERRAGRPPMRPGRKRRIGPPKPPRTWPCPDCGVTVGPRTGRPNTRCPDCTVRRTVERDREKAQRRQKPGNWTRPCPNCGVMFTRARGSKFCGAGCRSVAAMSYWRAPKPKEPPSPNPPRERACAFCDLPSGTRKWCSERCFNMANGRANLAVEVRTGHCRGCGKCYCVPMSVGEGFCSAACNADHTRRRNKAAYRQRRKERLGWCESFTLREIAERDGWCCHLCGGKVPNRKYAARDGDPTLDHLVPVSKGGSHTRDNVALAHNRCNWERGDALIEFQPRLIA